MTAPWSRVQPAVPLTNTLIPEGPSPGVLPPEGRVVRSPEIPSWVRRLILLGGSAGVAADNVTVEKSAVSRAAGTDRAFNGELITYVITVTNNTTRTVRDVNLLDVLPTGALQDVRCIPASLCSYIVEEREIPEPLGGTITVTTTRQISWTIPSIAPLQKETRTFQGRIVGQSDGAILKNQAFVTFQDQGVEGASSSNETRTTVLVRMEGGAGAAVSSAATWFSSDQGGTLSQSWGDFDLDGDLDLALGSSVGTTIYRNDNGHLRRLWGNARSAFGVYWGDVDGDGRLELVAVGDGDAGEGRNYVYSVGAAVAQETHRFTTTHRIVRAAPGDFDGDGDIDLILSTNSINAVCPVQLFLNDGHGRFTRQDECISDRATAAITPGDWDNDGDLDLAIGLFPNGVQLFVNDGQGKFPPANRVTIDSSVNFLPYDFSWGDFDADGFLDLAAAYPLQRQARIYRNHRGVSFGISATLRTDRFLTPLSVDWGDFTGNGQLDLAVADLAPTVYERSGPQWVEVKRLKAATVSGQVWGLRGVDLEGDGDLDLALTNRDGPSQLFTAFAPLLGDTIVPVPSTTDRSQAPSSSVTWGDLDRNGFLDLVFGAGPSDAGPTAVSAKIYYNNRALFERDEEKTLEGFGPHPVALGDATGDGALEIGLGTGAGNLVYLASDLTAPRWRSAPPHYRTSGLAWGDFDDDQDLDLLTVSANGPVLLYRNQSRGGTFQLTTQPVWQSAERDNSTSVAWADLNGDHYLDFVVGNDGQPNRIYLNDRLQNANATSFTLADWTPSILTDTTRAVAWGDYDGDGDLDLAVGNYGQPDTIYENRGVVNGKVLFGDTPIWVSPYISRTTSLAWGDWDNDGDLDLAVGHDGEPDVVYVNRRDPQVPSHIPQLFLQWASAERQRTTGLAWGDVDNDGDLDLAVSQRGDGATGRNGYYENTLIRPAHLIDDYASVISMPHNPTYVAVRRPGATAGAYLYSSPEILSGPQHPTVTVSYRLYDPDGARDLPGSDAPGRALPMSALSFEYSLDNGGSWRSATPAQPISPTQRITPTRLGQEFTFIWNAQADAAISENARFRVRLAQSDPVGPVARPVAHAVSPPFRVRGTTCVWPAGLGFVKTPATAKPGQSLVFTGFVLRGTGLLTFTWDFGDGSRNENGNYFTAQRMSHIYAFDGTYSVRLTVTGQPCPQNRPQVITSTVTIGDGITRQRTYFPWIASQGTTAARSSAPPVEPVPGQVQGLAGLEGGAGVLLTWQPPDGEAPVSGYRVYRSRGGAGFRPVASLDATARFWRDESASCGYAYFVTALNRAGEGPASPRTFYARPCPPGGAR